MINKEELSIYIDSNPVLWEREESLSPIHRSYIADLPLTMLVVHNYKSNDGSEWILLNGDGESLGIYASAVEAMRSGNALYKRLLKMFLGIEVNEEGGER